MKNHGRRYGRYVIAVFLGAVCGSIFVALYGNYPGLQIISNEVAKPVGRDAWATTEPREPSHGESGLAEPEAHKDFGQAIRLPAPPDQTDHGVVYPKFIAGGSGTRGSITDQEGRLIRRATEEHPIFSISISPDHRRIAVGAGDRGDYVIGDDGAKILDLPVIPEGEGMLALSNWIWLDNHLLIGESGKVQILNQPGSNGCCREHNMSESRFFVYDLLTSHLQEMLLPETLKGQVVKIGKVLPSGEFQLGQNGTPYDWYRLRLP